VWNQTLHEALTENGCKQNETDKCLYVKKESGKVKLEYVPTEVNIADLLTKPLGSVKTEALRKLAGLEMT
jgi:hypothetical protein